MRRRWPTSRHTCRDFEDSDLPISDSPLLADLTLPLSGQLCVALSGGMDSTVLVHALALSHPGKVRAVHVHHGLQDAADAWAALCARTCAKLGVPLQVCRVEVRDDGQGLEAAARDARYAALRGCLETDDVLVTAHHLDDQAETVLLRLLRGAGPTGLAAMRPLTEFAPGWLWRPLLQRDREELRTYAKEHKLKWVEDPQNDDPRFARSFIRRDILPQLRTHWPAATRNLARAADLAAESSTLLRELADSDLAQFAESHGPLHIGSLLELTPARRHNIVRVWLDGLGLPAPFHDTLMRLEREVLEAADDANPILAWPGAELRRYRGRLFAMPTLPALPRKVSIPWDGRGSLELPPGCGQLNTTAGKRRPTPCIVRLARPGDKFRPFGSPKTRTLKNLFQERGVPTWVRVRTPVVERDDALIWVGGIGWSTGRDWVAQRSEIEWLNRPPGATPDRSGT